MGTKGHAPKKVWHEHNAKHKASDKHIGMASAPPGVGGTNIPGIGPAGQGPTPDMSAFAGGGAPATPATPEGPPQGPPGL